MNDDVRKIRTRLSAWKANANTGIGFNATDVDVLSRALYAAEAERDEARELHAKVCVELAEMSVQRNHMMRVATATPLPQRVIIATPASAFVAGMIDCHACGDIHGAHSACDPDAVRNQGTFIGTVPSPIKE